MIFRGGGGGARVSTLALLPAYVDPACMTGKYDVISLYMYGQNTDVTVLKALHRSGYMAHSPGTCTDHRIMVDYVIGYRPRTETSMSDHCIVVSSICQ